MLLQLATLMSRGGSFCNSTNVSKIQIQGYLGTFLQDASPALSAMVRVPAEAADSRPSEGEPQGGRAGNAEPIRQRRRTNRSRDGCKTCRARHVKCDETQPVCQRCIISRKKCEYGLKLPLLPRQRPLSNAPLCQATPPEWDMVEAFRYEREFIAPKHLAGPDSAYTQILRNRHVSQIPSTPGFLMTTVIHRIMTISAQRGTMVRSGDCPGLSHLWRAFYSYMEQSITSLNLLIAEEGLQRVIFAEIIYLLSVDLAFMNSRWRAHIKGFLAFVDARGGVANLLKSKNPPHLPLQFTLVYGVANNVCSPANDQISGFDSWSDEHVLSIYSYTYCRDFPCPSRLFISLRQITALRVACAANPSPDAHAVTGRLVVTASAIAANVHGFSPRGWAERYELPREPLPSLLGNLFKSAVILYGMLSLPPALAGPFVTFGGDVERGDRTRVRRQHRAALLACMAEVMRLGADRDQEWACSWPLAVLGAACHDATAEERARVLHLIETIGRTPAVDCGAATLSELLPEFWASGKSAWEDCFYRPFQVM